MADRLRPLRKPARSSASELPDAVILGGTTTGLSLARSLADHGVDVYVLDKRESPARRSRLRREFVEIDPNRMQDEMLSWLRSGPSGAVVLAGGDEGLELIARHRAELLELGYRPMEADDAVLLSMLDKEATEALARDHGVPVAGARPLRDQSDVDGAIAELAFPCVLKPVHSHVFARQAKTGSKVLTAGSPAELQTTFEEMGRIGVELSAIEVITGPDDEYVSYYSYLDEQGEPLLELTKRKIRQNPPRFGIGTYHATSHDPELAALGLRFFQAVGLRGLGNVEFKRDGRDGHFKLIECNARFTMSNELIRRAGIDLALFSYSRLTGRPLPPVESYRDDLRLWEPFNDTRAFLAYRRAGQLTFRQWAGSLLHPQRFPVARLDDPIPCLLGHGQSATRAVTRSADAAWRRAPALALAHPFSSSGRRGRAIAARLDLARAAGAGYVWRRLRAERRLGGFGERVRNEVYDRIWREAAEAVGAQWTFLAPGLSELSRPGASTRVFQQVVDLDDPVTLRVALDKALVHRMLRAAGVPVAEHLEFDVGELGPALEFLARAPGACVVKPAAGTGGGHGITAGVRSPVDLRRACLHAATGGERLLIEHQAAGDVYRLLFLDGELLDIVRSFPPRLTGDGRSKIEDLIEAENQRRVAAQGVAGLSKLGVNLDMVMTLERAGLGLSSVLPADRSCALRTVTNSNSAIDNETFHGAVAPELIAHARTATEAVGLRLSGVDVITADPAKSLSRTDGIVGEVNGNPGLHHHYLVADQLGATRVAIPVLERLLDQTPADPGNA